MIFQKEIYNTPNNNFAIVKMKCRDLKFNALNLISLVKKKFCPRLLSTFFLQTSYLHHNVNQEKRNWSALELVIIGLLLEFLFIY